MANTSKVTAFVLDESIAGAADGVHVGGFPGIWRHDQPVSPEALGMTLAEMRDVVKNLDLPLREVKVSEREAVTSFVRAEGDELLPSSSVSPRLSAYPDAIDREPLDDETRAEVESAATRGVVDRAVDAAQPDGEES